MMGGVMMAKNAYTTKQVADNLGIVTSTLRKWCLMLENEELGNYKIDRNEKDQRVFYDYDVLALREIKRLTTEDGITLENAVKSVGIKLRKQQEITASVMEEEAETSAPAPDMKRYEEKLDRLLAYIERQDDRFDQQERFNRELLSKLDDQQKYIQESLQKRDEQLMIAIRETQETKRLIAAAEEAKPEPKKGFFARLFGK
jgi:DNA-binding transcriptional MerR regulator